jgi:hypothetical protein
MSASSEISLLVEPQTRENLAGQLSGNWSRIHVVVEAPLHGPKVPVYSVRLAELCSKCLRGVVRLREQPADQHELLYFTKIALRGLELEDWYVQAGADEDGTTLAVLLSTIQKDACFVRLPLGNRQEPHGIAVMRDLFDGQDALRTARQIFKEVNESYYKEGRKPPRW